MADVGIVIPQNIKNRIEEDTDLKDNDKAINYKGQYFQDDTEKKYYEAGAHFSYSDLFRRLTDLKSKLSPDRLYSSSSIESLNKQTRTDRMSIGNQSQSIVLPNIKINNDHKEDLLLTSFLPMKSSRNMYDQLGKNHILYN